MGAHKLSNALDHKVHKSACPWLALIVNDESFVVFLKAVFRNESPHTLFMLFSEYQIRKQKLQIEPSMKDILCVNMPCRHSFAALHMIPAFVWNQFHKYMCHCVLFYISNHLSAAPTDSYKHLAFYVLHLFLSLKNGFVG